MSVWKTTAKWELLKLSHLTKSVYSGAVPKGVIVALLALGQQRQSKRFLFLAPSLLRDELLAVPEIAYIKVALEGPHKLHSLFQLAYP